MNQKEIKDNLQITLKQINDEITLTKNSQERLTIKTEKVKELTERKNKIILALEQLKKVK